VGASSEGYTAKSDADSAITVIKKNVAKAQVE
jgi:uncharacterized protein YegP (UPF0339 family)